MAVSPNAMFGDHTRGTSALQHLVEGKRGVQIGGRGGETQDVSVRWCTYGIGWGGVARPNF